MFSNSYANAETLIGKGFRRFKITQLSGNEQSGVRFRAGLAMAAQRLLKLVTWPTAYLGPLISFIQFLFFTFYTFTSMRFLQKRFYCTPHCWKIAKEYDVMTTRDNGKFCVAYCFGAFYNILSRIDDSCNDS